MAVEAEAVPGRGVLGAMADLAGLGRFWVVPVGLEHSQVDAVETVRMMLGQPQETTERTGLSPVAAVGATGLFRPMWVVMVHVVNAF
jgi:hypothetical protein